MGQLCFSREQEQGRRRERREWADGDMHQHVRLRTRRSDALRDGGVRAVAECLELCARALVCAAVRVK